MELTYNCWAAIWYKNINIDGNQLLSAPTANDYIPEKKKKKIENLIIL